MGQSTQELSRSSTPSLCKAGHDCNTRVVTCECNSAGGVLQALGQPRLGGAPPAGTGAARLLLLLVLLLLLRLLLLLERL